MSEKKWTFDVWDIAVIAFMVVCILGVCATVVHDRQCSRCFQDCPGYNTPAGEGEENDA